MQHIGEGHPYDFVPAGKVSMLQIRNGKITVEDADWKTSNVGMVKRAAVLVIPVWFSGRNSWKFNLLGLFGGIRTVQLIHEIDNKRGKTVYMRFGTPILPKELSNIDNKKGLSVFFEK